MAQFVVNSTSVESLISSIKSGEIAIPEIQRPFVWDGSKVRDLMDSLYKGFPSGISLSGRIRTSVSRMAAYHPERRS